MDAVVWISFIARLVKKHDSRDAAAKDPVEEIKRRSGIADDGNVANSDLNFYRAFPFRSTLSVHPIETLVAISLSSSKFANVA